MEKQIKEFLNLIFVGGAYVPFKPKFDIETSGKITVQNSTSIANDTIEFNFSYIISDEFIVKLKQDVSLNKICNILIECLKEKKHNEANAILMELGKNEKFRPFYQHFIGTLVSNDLALVYKDKTITGSLYLPDGKTAFVSANIDEFGTIGMLDINIFDNIFDMAMFASYDDDGIGALISYSKIDKQIENLKEKGINPSLNMQIDFNQILKERHHSDLKNYMTLIHIFKDIIIGKIQDAMQSEKVKTK